MAALTATKVVLTEQAGAYRTAVYTVTPTTASDTIALSTDFTTVVEAIAQVIAGNDANLMTAYCTISGSTVTLVTIGADGLAATDWTSASVRLTVIGK